METPPGTATVADPRRMAHALFQYGAIGVVCTVLLIFVGWQIKRSTDREDESSKRVLEHLGTEEAKSQETLNALGSVARGLEGLAKQVAEIKDRIDSKRR